MKITGLEIAVFAALFLIIASIIIRLVWVMNTNWGEILGAMTAVDWLLTAAIIPVLVWLRLKK